MVVLVASSAVKFVGLVVEARSEEKGSFSLILG
jgi:hypothetical protein